MHADRLLLGRLRLGELVLGDLEVGLGHLRKQQSQQHMFLLFYVQTHTTNNKTTTKEHIRIRAAGAGPGSSKAGLPLCRSTTTYILCPITSSHTEVRTLDHTRISLMDKRPFPSPRPPQNVPPFVNGLLGTAPRGQAPRRLTPRRRGAGSGGGGVGWARRARGAGGGTFRWHIDPGMANPGFRHKGF